MLIHRLGHQPARRLLAAPPALSNQLLLPTISSQAISLQKRHAAFAPSSSPTPTSSATPNKAYEILARQRLNRPISPHLTIYRPQITWYLSALNRITGSLLSGGFYAFGAAYLASPLFGWHLESASMAEWFGGFHGLVKGGVKFMVAMPFVFHSLNGVRHLVWDTGREFGNVAVMRTGWFVVGASVVGSAVLAHVGS